MNTSEMSRRIMRSKRTNAHARDMIGWAELSSNRCSTLFVQRHRSWLGGWLDRRRLRHGSAGWAKACCGDLGYTVAGGQLWP